MSQLILQSIIIENLGKNYQSLYVTNNSSETIIEILSKLQNNQSLICYTHETTDVLLLGIINGSELYDVHFTPILINTNIISFKADKKLTIITKASGQLTVTPLGGHNQQLTINIIR